jgi:hypothetical protein
VGARLTVIYGTVKAGILGLTRGLAVEGSEHNILVNTLAPRANTTAFYYFNDASAPALKTDRPPEAVAPAVAYMCHEDCALNGAYVAAGGGHVSVGVFGVTAGSDCGPDITPEDVRDNIAAIQDISGFSQFPENLIHSNLALKDQFVAQ